MDFERLELFLSQLSSFYGELAQEVWRLKELGQARDDSVERYVEEAKRVVQEKNKIIQQLRQELGLTKQDG